MAGKFFVKTYGCTSNKFDSERMMGLLVSAGCKIVANPDDADYLLINTCGVKSQTEEKIIRKLSEFSKTDKKIIVAGCLPRINSARIRKAAPNFSAMLDTRSLHRINDVVSRIENGEENFVEFSEKTADKLMLPRFSLNNVVGIIKISEGCSSSCSFCATKFSRGELHSYRPESVRENIKLGLKEGCTEFHITSEDCSAYGKDIDINLADLLCSVTEIEGKFFVRVGMMNPLHLKKVEIRKLVQAFKSEKIFKFLHLCVQSGSNTVLQDMKRGYTAEDFAEYVGKFRNEIQNLTLETDIIAGFPTETEEDFRLTMEMLKEIRPDVVNLSKFTARPNTPAAEMQMLNTKIINRRSRELHKLIKKTSLEKNMEWIGWKGEVVVDEIKKNFVISRNFAYKSIVIKDIIPLGKFLEVEIFRADKHSLFGRV
jgi:threonylcarbamoyladenosine tRNA methylthiotransferase CDKAL1